MAHEFESGFFTHKAAWHGLGNVLKEPPTVKEALVASKTNWKVIEKPVYADMGQEFDKDNIEDVKKTPVSASNIPTYKAIVRETDKRVLGIVGANYQPVQNIEAFQWFDFLLKNKQATLEAGGSLKDGQKVWVLAKLLGEKEVVKNDAVRSYLLLCNSHDGSLSLIVKFTPIRVVCMNTLNAALSGNSSDERKGQAITIKHTNGIIEQMEFAKDLVNTTTLKFNDSIQLFKKFAKKKMTDKEFEGYFTKVWYGNRMDLDLIKEVDLQRAKRWDLIRQLFDAGNGQEIQNVRGTVWAGYNAMTEYVDYYRDYRNDKLDSLWFGSGADLRYRAFREAEKLVK